MLFKIDAIASMMDARMVGAHREADEIEWLLTDSRSLAFPETTLFFALKTRTGDGHDYIGNLYQRGVRHFVVAESFDATGDYPDGVFLVTSSPLEALQSLAKRHREGFRVPIIGITGSNGKTVVKEWLYQMLMPRMTVTRSPRSYNSQVGVPLSVCLLTERSEVGIFEAGISERGEMQTLQDIIQPTIGIITNIGQAHQENFSSLEEKCLEKLQLFRTSDVVVWCADDPIVAKLLPTLPLKARLLAWSRRDESAWLYVEACNASADSSSTTISYRFGTHDQRYTFTIPFVDEASVENALAVVATCLHLGCTPEYIAERTQQLEPVAMRMEVRRGVRGLTLINDSYNSDLNSLGIALDFAERRGGQGFVVILSDMAESGIADAELYGRVAEMLRQHAVGTFVGIGPALMRMRQLFASLNCAVHFFADATQLLAAPLLGTMRDALVLIKGARTFHFERLTDALVQKVHETTLEINLEAVAANLNHYRSFLQPATKMVCMIKAAAYGAGSIEIARTLQDRGVDYLAVAVADEGAELRRAGITSNIIVMNPEMSAFQTLFDYRLEPEVYSFELLDALVHAARSQGITSFPVHVKLDTGMHRLGFSPECDIPELVRRLQSQQALIPSSVFSHFAGSDSADFDDYTHHQFQLFDKASRQLQAAFPHKILRHICNSAAIERFPDYHLDMVRLGLGLYGINPIDNAIINNVCTLRTTILQVRDLAASETVGYSRRGTLRRPSRIAAIPIGYADGLNRHLGRGAAYCLVGGQRAPYVGNICMDVCMIDVTDIPCRAGDSVEIFGDNLPVTVLSDKLDTIPYEILTTISTRVKRLYFQ